MQHKVYRLSHVEEGPGPRSNLVWKLRSVFCFPLRALYSCRESSTNRPRFSQNKANLPDTEMSVNFCDKRDYENKSAFGVYEKQTQSNPISSAETVQWCKKSHPIHESLPGVKQDFFFFSSFVFLLITFCCIENYLLFMLSIILGRFGRP